MKIKWPTARKNLRPNHINKLPTVKETLKSGFQDDQRCWLVCRSAVIVVFYYKSLGCLMARQSL